MIRSYKEEDLDEIMQIWLSENIKAHNFIPKRYWTNNYDFVKSALPNSEVYVYEVSGEILGFIGIENSYIEGVFVKDGFKSKGIGSILIREAKSERNQLVLKVYQKNIKAIRFYEKEKFIIVKENLDQDTKEKEYIMAWKLDCQ